ncbi:tumor necrosis factor receptor superfamily member 6B isoform X2 [Gopherus flavomarginatus]|uniref:tumor necrosis factor receptor superfamily member 6B isoform X2 n=1 Tax=Gopherus flavomarginatus TaxID=286002 RepID=UPI0021CC2FEC|nr:tumor necrosis factor receptor superfamily member 6B isoform X2 [Gopherus flavomarginatus]
MSPNIMSSNANTIHSAMLSNHTLHVRHSSKWMVGAIVLFLAVPISSTTPTYPWRDPVTNNKVVCHQCPPGTFVAQHCTRDKPTVCAPCPDLHYTQYWNYLEKCRYCNVICGELQVELHQCNSTHNRVCQCRHGYYSESEFCIEHAKCPPGFGVVKLGTPHQNTKCEKCPQGFFSSSSSSTEPCKVHQSCSQQGKETNVVGNQFHDTLCTTCRMFKGNGTQESEHPGEKAEAPPANPRAAPKGGPPHGHQACPSGKVPHIPHPAEEVSLGAHQSAVECTPGSEAVYGGRDGAETFLLGVRRLTELFRFLFLVFV